MRYLLLILTLSILFCARTQNQDISNFYLLDIDVESELSQNDKVYVDSSLYLYHKTDSDSVKFAVLYGLSQDLESVGLSIEYGLYRSELLKKDLESYDEDEQSFRFTELAYGYAQQAYLYAMIEEIEESNYWYHQAYEISDSIGLTFVKGWVAQGISYCEEKTGNFDKALEYGKIALEASLVSDNRDGITNAYANYGYLQLKLGYMDSAIHYYKESLQYAVEEEQPDFAANALYILGSINIQLGNAERALKYLYKSLEIYQGLDEIYDQCLTMLSLGEVYELFGDAERAEKFYMEALEIAESIETRTVLADVYAHLGSLAKNQKNIEKSLAYYRKSEKLSEELQYASGYISARKKIGQILCEKDSVDIGIEYLESALELAELIVDFYESCDVHLKLGKQYLKKGEQNKAIHHLEEVYRLSENTNWRILREESARLLSTSYADKGQLQKAYDFLLIANDLSDSLNSADNQRALYEKEYDFKKAADSAKVVSILTQNNLDKVEVELKLEKRNKLVTNLIFVLILILGGILLTSLVIRARNKQREITFQQKSEKLKQQALLAQMNPHFLFNSLNSIQAIYTKGEITAANDFLADFGTLLRRILEFSSVETIRLSEEIELLDLYLRLEKIRAGKAIQYKIECGPDLATEIIQIPPMLIQPLIENAIIHGLKPKEKGGIIRIKFSEIEEGIMCIIEDDGVGLHAEKRVKFSDRKSLGLKILKERLGTRGKLLLEELETGGTRAVLIVRS